MKRGAFILSIGLLAALCGSCEPPMLAGGGGPRDGSGPRACPPFDDAKVVELAPGFNPDNYVLCPTQQACDALAPKEQNPGTIDLTPIRTSIRDAFTIAPDFFKKELCSTRQIFID